MPSMEVNIKLVVGTVVVYFATLAFYRLFLHPLARFPGPKLAAVSRWYEAYYDMILGGQYTAQIAEMHRIYGPIVRISPYELHIIDPTFYNTIYRSDGRWDKYAWAYDAFGGPNSAIFCSDHDVHKARRKAIAPFFSKPSVTARLELLRKNVGKLCRRVGDHAGTTCNVGAAISAFTRDNANEYIIGKAYNELDLDDFGLGLSISSQGAGSFWRITKHIRWFGPALRAMPISWAMKTADEGTQAFLRYLQQSEQDTRDAFAAAASPSKNDSEVQDNMIDAILRSGLPPSEKNVERILGEVAPTTAAAFDTTANALRLIVYHIYSNEVILQRLRDELASLSTAEPAALNELEQLPYLTAVLMEGMRLSPAIGSRAARVTDRELVYKEWRIPAGTPIGMTTLLMHTDEKLYPDPMSFNPDRWMDSTKTRGVATGSNFYEPFSRGTRMCVGMHLAWAELYLLVATLVQQFDLTIKDATASDFEMIYDGFAIGTKAGCNLMVNASPYKGNC